MFFSRQIRQFIAVARAGSFTRAADDIAVTPSALSHGIHELEQRLGKKIILRKRNGCILTSYGKMLYNEIAPLYDKSIHIFNKTKNEEPKVIISVDVLFNPLLPRKLHALFKKFGNRIEVKHSKSNHPLDEILDDHCDILLDVSYDLDGQIPDNVFRIALPPEKLVIVASDNIQDKYKNTMGMLKNENIFQSNAALSHTVFQKIKNHMAEFSVNACFIGLPDIYDVIGALTFDMGIALVSKNAVNHPILNKTNLNFIDMPKEFNCTINRGVYFKKERYNELSEIALCICNK